MVLLVLHTSLQSVNKIKKCLKDSFANLIWLLSMIEQQQKLIN